MMPVHPDFSVGARIPTSAEGDAGEVEPWCELVIDVAQDDFSAVTLELTRAAGEAILEVVNKALHPWAGKTIKQQIWVALDDATDTLMSGAGDDVTKGQAQGLAMALAIFTNPYEPNITAIRDEAVERWESVEEEGDSEDDADESVEAEGDSEDDDLPFG